MTLHVVYFHLNDLTSLIRNMYKMQKFMRQTLNWDFTLLTQNLQRSVANPAALKWENKVLPWREAFV